MTRRRSTTVVAAIAAIAAPALTATTTHAQDAVQWRVEDGGNGHWYVVLAEPGVSWVDMRQQAQIRGGHLASLTSEGENQFIVDRFEEGPTIKPWIGLRQDESAAWGWSTGEPLVWTNWSEGEPNGGSNETEANIWLYDDDPNRPIGEWNDYRVPFPDGGVVEWSADCNGDGIVDYGQILDGTVADCDGNGVPDQCDLNAVFAETQPGTPAGPTDYLTFDVSSLPDAQDTVTIEVSALGELAGPARFLFVYIDEPTVENRIGIVFGGGGANCLGLVETLEMPVGGWNDAGLDGSRSIIIAGSGLDSICGEDAYTGITVTVPGELPDCNDDGVWDVCTITDGTTPDGDGDGTIDTCDQCPADPYKIDPGVCGCGIPDLDTDADGLADCVDPCPTWPYECSEDGQTIVVAADQSIQLAIDVIPDGGTIELSASTFLPSATLEPRGRDFTLRGAVDPVGTLLTVIDGQNTIRILNIDGGETASLLIQNLVIRNGYSGSGAEDHGGGVRIFNADATIENCIFEDNTGTNYGGALAIHNDDFVSDTTVSNCIFRNNTAVDGSQTSGIGGRGGAISVYRGDPVITGCLFIGNQAQDEGGALHCNSGATSVSMCDFDENIADDQGGAVFLFLSTASFVQCAFTDNMAISGGGIHTNSASPTITNCTFTQNESNLDGGAICFAGTQADVQECSFDGNRSANYGGAIAMWKGDITVTDCDFISNEASYGGGLGQYRFADENVNSTITGCRFVGNYTTGDNNADGGGFYASGGTTASFVSCTFDANTSEWRGGGLSVHSDASIDVLSCDIRGNSAASSPGGLTGGGGLINTGGTLSIENSAVCENIPENVGGQNGYNDLGGNCVASACDSDLDGTPDCLDGCPDDPNKVDPGICGCGVPDDGDSDSDGIPDCLDPCPAWPDECSGDGQTIFVAVGQSIQEALIAVPTGGTVEIAAGTFKIDEGIDGVVFGFGDRSIRGASNTDGEPTTIIDAGAFGRIMTLSLGQTNASIIENLVLVNGRQAVGGAVSLLGGSNPTFRNCWFQDNSSALDGGAIYTAGSSPIFESCRFIDNLAEEEGGAVYATDASVTFVDCDFDGNTALGGGAIVFEASPFNEVTSSTFRNNTADRGGAIYLGESYLFLNESSVSDNVASISGAAIMVYQSTLELDSSIVCGNFPADQISGTFQDLGNNCIVDDCGNDLDGNDVPDACDPDCDGDGVPDAYEIATGTQLDCDIDGIPDECSIEDGMALDCNENGIPDTCDLDSGGESDANDNDIPDSCDIAAGDLNVDGCVDAEDLGLILALWGIEGAPVGDLDGDGVVQASDLGVLLAAWRPCDP